MENMQNKQIYEETKGLVSSVKNMLGNNQLKYKELIDAFNFNFYGKKLGDIADQIAIEHNISFKISDIYANCDCYFLMIRKASLQYLINEIDNDQLVDLETYNFDELDYKRLCIKHIKDYAKKARANYVRRYFIKCNDEGTDSILMLDKIIQEHLMDSLTEIINKKVNATKNKALISGIKEPKEENIVSTEKTVSKENIERKNSEESKETIDYMKKQRAKCLSMAVKAIKPYLYANNTYSMIQSILKESIKNALNELSEQDYNKYLNLKECEIKALECLILIDIYESAKTISRNAFDARKELYEYIGPSSARKHISAYFTDNTPFTRRYTDER